jgi:two-component system phosphate regulon sensor histidine kinase PhoR
MAGEAARMTRLVDDLLALSQIEFAARQPPAERCEPKALLEQVVERMYAVAAPGRVRLEVSIPSALPEIVADPDQLHQLFANLIDNAIKDGGEGKTVWVDAAEIEAAPPDAGPVAGRPAVRVSVRDQGPGIAKEHIPRLTERFYRVDSARSRKLRGTGLGLAIVKHILRRHQGHLAIDSEPGHGSSFIIFLPAAACHEAVAVTS